MTQVIRQSESYPKYWLIKVGEVLKIAMKPGEGWECPNTDGWYHIQDIGHEEDFETHCDNLDEEFRYLRGE